MQIQPSEIETIVRAVLKRLRSESAALSTGEISRKRNVDQQPVTTGSSRTGAIAVATSSDTHHFPQPLLTLADVELIGSGVKTVSVSARAVVTPAVRDELRRRGIALTKGSQSPSSVENSVGKKTQSQQNLVIVPQTKLNHAASQLGSVCQVRLLTTAAEELAAISSHVGVEPAARVLWCTAEPFAAECMVSRQATMIRCVTLHEFNDLPQAILEAAPNLMIVDDRRWTAAALINLVRQWERLAR